jgi:hypothetical protein
MDRSVESWEVSLLSSPLLSFSPLLLPSHRWETMTRKATIKCIHRIENIELWRAYCSKRDGLERLRGDANEQWYWHGTRLHAPEVIAKEGFDFRVANPGSYGRGAYFAHSINYSSNGYQHTMQQPSPIPSLPLHPTTPARRLVFTESPPRGPPAAPSPFRVNQSPILIPGFPPHPSPQQFPTASTMDLPAVGDSQLILARVCVGNTIISATNQVSPSLSFELDHPSPGTDSTTRWL